MVKFLQKNPYNIFLVVLVFLNIVPWLAPVFLHFGWHGPAKVIYRIYSFFCHQIAWRSMHVYDHQCAWCARDTAIWGAFLMVAVLIKFRKTKGFKWYWMIPFIIPIALDGGIQTIATVFGYDSEEPVYISTNFMRMMTGSIFGIGLGMTLLPTLKNDMEYEEKKH